MENFKLGELPIAISNSFAINFDATASAGDNCEKICSHYGVDCYAEKSEKRQPNLIKSGRRRALSPVQLVNSARLQIRHKRRCWARISSRGSVPKVSKARKIAGFIPAFKALISEIVESDSPLHFPVESARKREFYQSICDEAKPGAVVVRESVHSRRSAIGKTGINRSYVVGASYDGLGIAGRIEKARALACKIRTNGETAIVCPKIKPRNHSGRVAKCGECTACADRSVLVVLYPKH